MNVELLYIAGCPGWRVADERTRRALDALGLRDVVVRHRVVATATEAGESGFAGSPTILIDGADAFASAERVTELSCRLYPTPEGLRGSPTVEQIGEALRARRA